MTPQDKLEGGEREICAARDRKLEAAREGRRLRRQAARAEAEKGATEKSCERQTAGAYC